MLNALFGSEAKTKLLNLFLLHPEDQYCITQIARDLKLPTSSIAREIENILKFGLIIPTSGPTEDIPDTVPEENNTKKKKKTQASKEEKPEKKYYKINKNFILYPEIRSLFIKAQILSSQKFILSIEKSFQPKLFILTGFFTNYPEASTDILIVGKVKRPAFLKLISELEKDLGREINFTILEEREFRYRQEIMDIFLYTILDGQTITLINTLSEK